MKKVIVIGSGFSGLSAACYLAKLGYQVEIFEKNNELGGRARVWKKDGYTFDMGPSWYWMPDVFQKFFSDMGCSISDYFQLISLDPAFQMVFENNTTIQVPSDFENLVLLFESIEAGAGEQLRLFMKEAKAKYEFCMKDMIYKPGLSIMEYVNLDTLRQAMKMSLFTPYGSYVRQFFRHPYLISLMEFPVLFLGAKPQNTPSLYSIMNYAGLVLGTWYPIGGMGKIVDAMVSIAQSLGVVFHTQTEVTQIITSNHSAIGIMADQKEYMSDIVISSADYEFTESSLLDSSIRNYNDSYWESRVMSPSALVYYLGITQKLNGLLHHTLFFDEDINLHAEEIYDTKKWPSKPLFYVCCPSQSDTSVAPNGCENLFLLMPIASGLEDTEDLREKYFQEMIHRLENYMHKNISSTIVVKRSYCLHDFQDDYHSYKGNAYGLANTLNQTAVYKPKIKNKHVNNLYYTGQLTVPGPGVPPALISGKIVADYIHTQKPKSK